MRALIVLITLAGCVDDREPGECPQMISEVGRQMQAECERKMLETKARAAGQPVTTCAQSASGITCVTD